MQHRSTVRSRAAAVVLALTVGVTVTPTASAACTPVVSNTEANTTITAAVQPSTDRHKTHRKHRAVPAEQVETPMLRRPWGAQLGPETSWDGGIDSLDRIVHLAGLVMGSALLLGGFHRGRRR